LQGGIDALGKLTSRHTRDIEELREALKKNQGASSITASLPIAGGGDSADMNEFIALVRALE
jgi:hypothetical protein